jgi:hypothetical protein
MFITFSHSKTHAGIQLYINVYFIGRFHAGNWQLILRLTTKNEEGPIVGLLSRELLRACVIFHRCPHSRRFVQFSSSRRFDGQIIAVFASVKNKNSLHDDYFILDS